MAENDIKVEIDEIKEEIRNISAKVDQVLQMLSDFTIMLLDDSEEEDDDDEEDYGYEDSWVPDEDEFWKNEED